MQTLADQLAGVSSGAQKGRRRLAVGRQAQQAAAQQFAAARMARGANAGDHGPDASRGSGDLGTNAAGIVAQSALQDQTNACGQPAACCRACAARPRPRDANRRNQQRMLQQGQFGQQANLANQAAGLQNRAQNDPRTRAATT